MRLPEFFIQNGYFGNLIRGEIRLFGNSQGHFSGTAVGTNLWMSEGDAEKHPSINSYTTPDKTGSPGHFYEFMDKMDIMDDKFRGDFEFMDDCESPFYQMLLGFYAFSYENA